MYTQVQSLNTADVWQIVTILPSSWPPGELCTGNTSVCIQNLYNISSGPQPSRSATLLNVSQSFVFFCFFGWLEPSSCGAAVRVLFHRFTHTLTERIPDVHLRLSYRQRVHPEQDEISEGHKPKNCKKKNKLTDGSVPPTRQSTVSVARQQTAFCLPCCLLSVFFFCLELQLGSMTQQTHCRSATCINAETSECKSRKQAIHKTQKNLMLLMISLFKCCSIIPAFR